MALITRVCLNRGILLPPNLIKENCEFSHFFLYQARSAATLMLNLVILADLNKFKFQIGLFRKGLSIKLLLQGVFKK